MPASPSIASLLAALFLILACAGEEPVARDEPAAAAAPGLPLAPPIPAPAVSESPQRGLWVLAEGSSRVLEDPARVAALIEHASALAATDLFVQVFRGGRAWYDASLVDATPYRGLREVHEIDTLADLLLRAHARGIRVHAWVNVLSLSLNRTAPLLDELGREAVLVDRRGRSLLDYPELEVPAPDSAWYRMGTRGVYLDPAAPGVRERLVAIFSELVRRYPELDGLHLDYVRHPDVLPLIPGSRFGVGLDFGYGPASRERFRLDTGLPGPYRDPAGENPHDILNADRWDAWRRDQVTALVSAIRNGAQAERPGLLISAAVNAYVDRAYLSLFQDWKRWLEEGLIDLAIPMAYTTDDRLLRYQLESFAGSTQRERIWPGLGTWLFAGQPQRALEQIAIARRSGLRGDALFSYDAIRSEPALYEALVDEASGQPAR